MKRLAFFTVEELFTFVAETERGKRGAIKDIIVKDIEGNGFIMRKVKEENNRSVWVANLGKYPLVFVVG